jgi:glutaredoxin
LFNGFHSKIEITSYAHITLIISQFISLFYMPLKLKLFWKEGCEKCEQAKKMCKELDIKPAMFNLETVDGMAEACWHQITTTPALALTDEGDRELKVWRSVLQAKKELTELKQQGRI